MRPCLALASGEIPAALDAHQKLLVWRPNDAAMHQRVASTVEALVEGMLSKGPELLGED